mmetsp:Transcript_55104/g.131323  ORF Transcript_55104/g.131323 Transcript_55104/m.131323 type:complete len:310 (-) Transcript_55104:15-944(-)
MQHAAVIGAPVQEEMGAGNGRHHQQQASPSATSGVQMWNDMLSVDGQFMLHRGPVTPLRAEFVLDETTSVMFMRTLALPSLCCGKSKPTFYYSVLHKGEVHAGNVRFLEEPKEGCPCFPCFSTPSAYKGMTVNDSLGNEKWSVTIPAGAVAQGKSDSASCEPSACCLPCYACAICICIVPYACCMCCKAGCSCKGGARGHHHPEPVVVIETLRLDAPGGGQATVEWASPSDDWCRSLAVTVKTGNTADDLALAVVPWLLKTFYGTPDNRIQEWGEHAPRVLTRVPKRWSRELPLFEYLREINSRSEGTP